MKKSMLMSVLAGAILITTATTSCKKGDQGPAGANGKGISSLETNLLHAQLEYNKSLQLETEFALNDAKEDVVVNWVTKEDKDKSTQNLSLYLNQVEYDKLKADADKYVSDAEYDNAQALLKNAVTTGIKKERIEAANKLTGEAKSIALEEADRLVEITTTRKARLESLTKTTSNPDASKKAKDKAKNAILDVDGKLKAAAQAIDAKLVVSQFADVVVTDQVKTHTLNSLKKKAAKAKLETAEKALADSIAPVATAPKAPVSVK